MKPIKVTKEQMKTIGSALIDFGISSADDALRAVIEGTTENAKPTTSMVELRKIKAMFEVTDE